MIIRKAKSMDAHDLKVLYFENLAHFPPKEEQDMDLWRNLLDKFEHDEHMHLLVAEEDGKVVSSVQMAIVENLTHNVRPFVVIENVVTRSDYRKRGYGTQSFALAIKYIYTPGHFPNVIVFFNVSW